jgi:hypothetical protein
MHKKADTEGYSQYRLFYCHQRKKAPRTYVARGHPKNRFKAYFL